MKTRYKFLSFVFLIACASVVEAQSTFVDGVSLTTISAPWVLRIPGNGLDITNAQAKPDQKSAYFMLTSESTRLNVSVFIEPVDKCKTNEECRDYVLGLGNPEWGTYQDLSKGKIKDLSYFEFYRPEVHGQPVKMQDMYAEYVGQGYWIDLHISKVLFQKEDHKLFENLINSINFVLKSGKQSIEIDPQNSGSEKSAATWLGLWDQVKCRESYLSLSAITQKEIAEKEWVDYCIKLNTSLGTVKSRTLIAAAFTKSLPTKTDRPLAILAYHSGFVNRQSVVEIIGLLLKDDGTWTVTNYLPR